MFGTPTSSTIVISGLIIALSRCSPLASDSSFPMATLATGHVGLVNANASLSVAASSLRIYLFSPFRSLSKAKETSQA